MVITIKLLLQSINTLKKNILDEDPSFPASELNTHGPTVHGWRSKQNTTISPQEIVLRLHYPAKICRIQVLAHQHLIRKYRRT